MTTERLFEFLVLSQILSFSKASTKLFMTQATLSRHIMELEAELGVKLLERSTHSVRLTPQGRIFASRLPRLIGRAESAYNRLRFADIEPTGSVSIACLENHIHEQLTIFLAYFTSKYPDIDLRLDIISSEDIPSVVESHDMTFTAFELQSLPGGVSASRAFRTPGVLSVSAEHTLATLRQITPESLSGETLIVPYADEMFCSYSTNRQIIERLTGGKVNILKVPSIESALALVSIGKGVAIVPQHIPQNMVMNVWTLDIVPPVCTFDTYLYHNTSLSNCAAALFADEFEAFANSPGESD